VPRRSRAFIPLLAAALAAGCAAPEPTGSARAPVAEPPRQATHISYELTDQGVTPLLGGMLESAPAPLPAETTEGTGDPFQPDVASGDRRTDGDRPRPSSCHLEIEQFADAARARLTVATEQPGTEPTSDRRSSEVYQLDLSAAELSLIMDDLNASGFFGGQKRPDGGATVTVAEGETVVSKAWTPEPRLDDLAERVYREGRRLPPKTAGRARVTAGR
jgi:hypothetical protein